MACRLEIGVPHDLHRQELWSERGTQPVEIRQGINGTVGVGQNGLSVPDGWLKLEDKASKNTQSAFRPNEHLFHFIAFIGFDDLFKVVHHSRIWQENFEPKNPLTHHTVAKRFATACVTGDHAANTASTACCQIVSQGQSQRRDRIFQLCQCHTCIDNSDTINRVDISDRVHMHHHDHQLPGHKGRATRQTGKTTLRYNRGLGFCTPRNDGRDIFKRFKAKGNSGRKTFSIKSRILAVEIT